jgi:hypothetical protein
MNKELIDYAIYGDYNAKINDTQLTSKDQCTGLAHYRSDLEQGCKDIGPGWVNDPAKDVYNPETSCIFDNGYKGTCVLKEAHGDPTNCCIGGTSQTGSAACPATYVDNRFSSSQCRDKWQTVCRPEDYVDSARLCASDKILFPFGTSIDVAGCKPENPCFRYAQTNPNDSYIISRVGPYCSNNLTKKECRDFCLANPGACDSGVKAYCARSDKDVQFCSCVNSPAAAYDGLNPVCVDADCKTSASYRTAAMKQITQCVAVNCNIIQNLTAGGNFKFTDNIIKQNCGANLEGNGSKEDTDLNVDAPIVPVDQPDEPVPVESVDSTQTEFMGMDMISIGIGIGVLFFILIIIMVLVFVMSGSSERRRLGPRRR